MKFKDLLLGAMLLVFCVLAFTLVSGCSRTTVEKGPAMSTVRDYEEAWLIAIDRPNQLVQVQTVTTKIDIVFKADKEFLDFLEPKVGGLAAVTFYCGNPLGKVCDLRKPYVLYVNRRKVEPVIVQKSKK